MPRPGPPRTTPAGSANKYIAYFTAGTSPSARAAAVQQAGATLRRNFTIIEAAAVTVPNENALNALRRHGSVTRVVPDRTVRAFQRAFEKKPQPPPPAPPPSGGRRQVRSYEVQRVGGPADGTGIGVAVFDTGIDFQHTDLAPAPDTIPATAFSAFGSSCDDDGGHGNHVSGLIAALDNNQDIVGVAPNAKLYCVKVLLGTLSGDDSDVIAGLQWVRDHYNTVSPPIRIVNMSLGRFLDTANGETLDNSVLLAPIQALYNLGISVVVSAGNEPAYEVTALVPSGFREVIAVGGTVATNGINLCPGLTYVRADTAFTNGTDGAFVNGRGVTVSAPAEERVDILSNGFSCSILLYGTLSTTMGGGATRKIPSQIGLFEARGTSFASPLVAGVVARVLQLGLVAHTSNASEVENVRLWLRNNADRRQGTDPSPAPLDHPLNGVGGIVYTFDGVREGIVSAP
ncbi:MAG: S8 family serine peptidase [Bryobacteraceae bacterium]